MLAVSIVLTVGTVFGQAAPAAKAQPMRGCLIDSLQPLFPDSKVAKRPTRKVSLEVARGGTVSVHVLLNNVPPKSKVSFSASGDDGQRIVAARWFRLIDVPVEKNTGLKSFVERGGVRNPHVIRRAPFRVYDAMEPVGSSITAKAGTMALRLAVPIARTAQPGQVACALQIRCGEATCDLAVAAIIHKAVVPLAGKDSLPYTNWFSLPNMASRHGVKQWSEGHWQMIDRYARLMVHGRQNAFWIPWSTIFTRDKTGLVLNRRRLRRIVKTFTRAGMHIIEGGHVARRTGGKWESPTYSMVLGGPLATSDKGRADLARAAAQLVEEINRNGWRNRWIQHIADEPIAVNADDYSILSGMVRKQIPGVPIVDATMVTKLVGAVDIWCPQDRSFQQKLKFFQARQAAGDRVWFYTCCSPGGPWLNRLLDQELLRPALFGWASARFDLDGFLHWGLNHYRSGQDPFTKSVVPHGTSHLPAGDTHVVYPGKDGPWSSIRFEAHREGFEDYELLKRLKARRPKLAAKIIAQAIRGFDDYTKDTRTFRQARKALLKALDE
jgi:hypothetical protein